MLCFVFPVFVDAYVKTSWKDLMEKTYCIWKRKD